ncbi:MAG: hypothetical protein Q9160_007639 [Pyrenula sp. 1 TL-2023]
MTIANTYNGQESGTFPSDVVSTLQKCQDESEKTNPPVDLSRYRLLHQVLSHRATDPVQVPLIAFPKHRHADFQYFTAKDLHRFANNAAWIYEEKALRTTKSRTVAIFGQTNINWVVSLFALSMLGYTVLSLSPRLPSAAIVKLLKENECECLVHGNEPPLLGLVRETTAVIDVQSISMLSKAEYDDAKRPSCALQEDPDQEARPAVIMHSSGSTGLPKSLKVPHYRLVKEYPLPGKDRNLVTLPLYHTFALTILPTQMYRRRTVHFLNPDLPTTCKGLTEAIKVVRPELLSTVPYMLKLLAEEQNGIEAMRECKYVLSTGSQCPDDLGHRLVQLGVNLGTLFGSTETGFVADSLHRPKEDKAWNYMRVPSFHMDHIFPRPVAEGLFEFVYLKDYPNRIVTNSDDPLESFYSKDILTPHPSIPSAWKFVTRIDDRVTLLNGEKVLPLPIEGHIKQHALVREAVVFGIGKAVPGILLFRADDAKDQSDDDFVDKVWPTIEEANKHAESFSQISKNMVVPLPSGTNVPQTDKGSVIRAQAHKVFENEIENVFDQLEHQQEGSAVLDTPALVEYLQRLGGEILGKPMSNPNEDLFSLGMNSLQALEMRGAILKHLNLGGNGKKLSQNVVFEQGNISNLAKHLEILRLGATTGKEKPIALIEEMVAKYSVTARPRETIDAPTEGNVIVLTGATGGLGVHLLTQLANHPRTSHIYCLLRGYDAEARLKRAVKERHNLSLPSPEKYTVLTSSLHESNLGLSDGMYAALKARTTHIIHGAWPVNFQLGLPSFSSSLQGLQNLLQLSLATTSGPRSARLTFCSSISVALDTTAPATIPELPIADLEQVSGTGYAASKLVGEKIVEKAVRDANANASVVRIGQIVGDSHAGLWNDTEMVPLMIRSALTMGMLPELDGERCCWLPLDVCAKAIVEIEGLDRPAEPEDVETAAHGTKTDPSNSGQESKRLVYNVSSPLSFRWNEDLLPALKELGMHFETVPFSTWIERLRKLAAQTTIAEEKNDTNGKNELSQNGEHPAELKTTIAAADPEQNPALKLVDFFEESYSGDHAQQSGGVTFAIDEAAKASPSLRNMEGVIESGLLGKMLDVWMRKWKELTSSS